MSGLIAHTIGCNTPSRMQILELLSLHSVLYISISSSIVMCLLALLSPGCTPHTHANQPTQTTPTKWRGPFFNAILRWIALLSCLWEKKNWVLFWAAFTRPVHFLVECCTSDWNELPLEHTHLIHVSCSKAYGQSTLCNLALLPCVDTPMLPPIPGCPLCVRKCAPQCQIRPQANLPSLGCSYTIEPFL